MPFSIWLRFAPSWLDQPRKETLSNVLRESLYEICFSFKTGSTKTTCPVLYTTLSFLFVGGACRWRHEKKEKWGGGGGEKKLSFKKTKKKRFETNPKKRFVSVYFGVSNLYQNTGNKQNCFETKRNNPKFSEKYQNMLSIKQFRLLFCLFRFNANTETLCFSIRRNETTETNVLFQIVL